MVNRIYIEEGADGIGKSNIGKVLADLFGWTYYKNKFEGKTRFTSGEDPKLAFKYETQIAFNFFEQLPNNITLVLDRFTISEFCYAKALNRPFDEGLVWKIDEKLAQMDARILYFYQPKIKDNFEDEWVSKDIQEKVKEFYKEYLAKTKCRFTRIDTSSLDLSIEIAQILKSGILWD